MRADQLGSSGGPRAPVCRVARRRTVEKRVLSRARRARAQATHRAEWRTASQLDALQKCLRLPEIRLLQI